MPRNASSFVFSPAMSRVPRITDDDIVDQLPRCGMTDSTADLHLVVYGEGLGTVAELPFYEAR
jgi:hypothetical protein